MENKNAEEEMGKSDYIPVPSQDPKQIEKALITEYPNVVGTPVAVPKEQQIVIPPTENNVQTVNRPPEATDNNKNAVEPIPNEPTKPKKSQNGGCKCFIY
jgi:hypothetical protein